ncbi:MAG: ASCH domain-containing protein, partial [Sulfitobacter sp.]
EKAMGLKPGEKIKKISQIRIISTRTEPLSAITSDDCVREGFPDFTPAQFIEMLTTHYKCDPAKPVNRIEFEYI